MTDQELHSRRKLLQIAGATTAASLAGCTDLLEGGSSSGSTTDTGYEDDDEDDDDDDYETSYRLELQGDNEIDLTPLEGYSPEDLPETEEDLIEQGFYTEITPVLYKEKGNQTEKYEGQEEIEEELEQELTLIIDGQEQEYTNIILENQLENDQYQLEITPKIGDESTRIELGLTDQTTGITIEKKAPNTTPLVPYYEGEPLNQPFPEKYPVPDTSLEHVKIDIDEEHFQQLRQQHIENDAWPQIYEQTLEQDKIDFNENVNPPFFRNEYSHGGDDWKTSKFEQHQPEDVKKIIQDSGTAFLLYYAEIYDGGPSGQMNNKVATTKRLKQEHIDQEIDLRVFMTRSRGEVGHGNATYYIPDERIDYNWLNYDIDGGVISKPSEAPNARDPDQFFPPNDYTTGKIEHVSYGQKKRRGVEAAAGPFRLVKDDGSGLSTLSEFDIDDVGVEKDNNRIRDQKKIPESREKALQALTYAAATREDYEYVVNFGGEKEENHFLMTNITTVYDKFREEPEHVTVEKAKNEI